MDMEVKSLSQKKDVKIPRLSSIFLLVSLLGKGYLIDPPSYSCVNFFFYSRRPLLIEKV